MLCVHYISQIVYVISVDIYQNSKWNENVLHWACQGKNKNIQVLQLLLDLHGKWVLY